MPHARPSDRQRAADQLANRVEQAILSGEYAPGQVLPPEREIVERHGVSRTVVREALRALSSRGVIETRPGFRPVVAHPGFDTALGVVSGVVTQLLGQPGGVRNLFDLRIRMETSLVREAALSAQAQDIEELEAALEANEQTIDVSTEFYRSDMAFHAVLYDIPRNPVLPAIHRAYVEWLSPHWTKMPRSPERNRMNFEAHKSIFDSILRRNPDRAEDALRAHLDQAWQQVSNTFKAVT